MKRVPFAVLPLAFATAGGVHAQSAALDPMVVSATRTERAWLDVPASVDLVDGVTVRDAQLRVNLSESLGRVPGLVILNRQNYAQDLQLSVRGFGSRATFGVRGLRLYVDGVPASFPDGQGQVSHFPLNATESIEILRGPFSALYGNSSGGVISLTTALKPQPLRVELSGAAGSNDTWRAGVNLLGGTDPYAYALDAGRFSTDGFRDHSAATRDSLNLRFGIEGTPIGRVRLALNSVSMPDSQDPLGLTRAQMEADPEQASPQALQFNTRKTTRQTTLGGEVRTPLTPALALTSAAWVGTRSVEQYQAIPVATQLPPTNPGGVIDFDRGFGGVDLRLGIDHGIFTTSVGVTAEQLDEDRLGYNNFTGTGASQVLGVKGALRRDETNRVEGTDLYFQTEARLAPAWRLHAGVRTSEIRFESEDHYIVGVNGDDSGSTKFSGTSPTVGVVYKLSDTASLYASYGRGFETPTLNELAYRPDGSAGLNTDLRAAKSDNYEVGAKARFSPKPARRGRALCRAHQGRHRRAHQRRRPFDLHQRRQDAAPGHRGLRRVDHRSALVVRGGGERARGALRRRIPDVRRRRHARPRPCRWPTATICRACPSRRCSSSCAAASELVDLALEFRAQAPLYVDDRNTDRAAGYGVVNASAARTFTLAGTVLRGFVRVDNLFDREYVGSVIVNEANSRFFEPAPGRTFLVGLDARF